MMWCSTLPKAERNVRCTVVETKGCEALHAALSWCHDTPGWVWWTYTTKPISPFQNRKGRPKPMASSHAIDWPVARAANASPPIQAAANAVTRTPSSVNTARRVGIARRLGNSMRVHQISTR